MSSLKKCVLVRRKMIDETLQSAPAKGKRGLEPLKSFAKETSFPVGILEDVEIECAPEVHLSEADLWYCIEGEVDFVYGGKLIGAKIIKHSDGSDDDKNLTADTISGGTEATLKSGDWLYIPAGQPHQHGVKGVARLFIIKIPEPEVPLEGVPGWGR